ncbi:hypothetical protein AB0L57_22810 [Nocardia sp. NPDC052254]|uniref:hypothetical protein n=1 Tax=Nocardia sp. NPDC052254 TaxID=3155681 RepID=UPI00342B6042
MSDEIRLDLDGLRERGARLADLADRVGQTYAGLEYCLRQAEGSWGDDHMGREFAEQFTPHADHMLANVRAMQKGLRSTADGIVGVADEFDARDAANANRLTAPEDRDSGNADPAGQQRDGATGPVSPADAGPAARSDPASISPARESPVPESPGQPTAGPQRTEQPAAGGAQSPDGFTGRAAPADGTQSRSPWNRSRPESDRSDRDGRIPGDSGRRTAAAPPSPSVTPPADRRDAPRATDTSSGSRTAAPAGRRGTPWTDPSPRTPGSPGRPGSPGKPAANPRNGSPPRPNQSRGDKARAGDRRGSRERAASDPMIDWLARRLAERHGVQVAGFDTPGLRLPAVRDFVAAVDRVLTDYPMVALDVVEVAEFDGAPGTVRWSCAPRGVQGPTRSMTLDRRAAQEPEATTPTAESDGEPAQPGIHPATLREFGRALDAAGGGVASKQAQRVLIAEYLRPQPHPARTLGEVVSGYRDWRAALTGTTSAPGEFDVSEALGIAFAEVVEHGADAGIQARLLHAVLVAAASRPV